MVTVMKGINPVGGAGLVTVIAISVGAMFRADACIITNGINSYTDPTGQSGCGMRGVLTGTGRGRATCVGRVLETDGQDMA